jgi:phenylacetate-CoA ligase
MNKLQQRIYALSPSFLQNLGVTYYGWGVYRREYGRKLERLLDEFEKHQWHSADQLRAYQEEKLRDLIRHCYDHVPYYRRIMTDRKLVPSDIVRIEDLAKLPLLTKEDVRAHSSELLATNIRKSQLVLVSTSGTTGSPLQMYSDKGLCLIKNVIDWRQKRVAGISVGERVALFLGRVIVRTDRQSPPFWRSNWALRHKYFSSFHMSPKNMASYIAELKRFEPAAIEGYPSTLFIIASYLVESGSTLPVRAAFTSSETLFPRQRETIEKAFGCRVWDFYGMAERVVFATECEVHDDKHLNTDFGITEIVDANGIAAAPDELGRVVSTGLHNLAMPLVRYKTSDISSLKSAHCSCGRGFPLISGVTSKADDIVTTPDGRFISPVVFEHPFKPLRTVLQSQIVQEDREHLRIRIVQAEGYTAQDTDHILREVRNRVGAGMEIEIDFVDRIELTSAGKFRRVVSKVPLKF